METQSKLEESLSDSVGEAETAFEKLGTLARSPILRWLDLKRFDKLAKQFVDMFIGDVAHVLQRHKCVRSVVMTFDTKQRAYKAMRRLVSHGEAQFQLALKGPIGDTVTEKIEELGFGGLFVEVNPEAVVCSVAVTGDFEKLAKQRTSADRLPSTVCDASVVVYPAAGVV